VDGESLFAGEAWQIIVSVSGAFGGGSSIEEADPGDGRLHVTVVPTGSRLGLLRRAAGMRRGDLAGQPGVPDVEGHEVELGLGPDEEVNLDGELCHAGRITVEPAAFSLVVG
jgi:diacylglycerol kinase family enzyme